MSTKIVTSDDLDPQFFGCKAGVVSINCDAINGCINQSQVSVSASGDPDDTIISNVYIPDPDCTAPGVAVVTQTIMTPDQATTYSSGTVPVNGSQNIDFTAAPYAPARVFLIQTVVVDDCGTTTSYDLITIDAATVGDATVTTQVSGPPEATDITTTYVPHPDCVDPGTPIANREIWDTPYVTLLSGPDPVTLGGDDTYDFTDPAFLGLTQFIICTNVIDNCGSTNLCEILTINKTIDITDGTDPIPCGAGEAVDLDGYFYQGTAYTTYATLAHAILVNEGLTYSEVVCGPGGTLQAIVNGNSPITEVVLSGTTAIPFNEAPGGPAVPCTPGDESGTLTGYQYNGSSYSSYAPLQAAIIANEASVTYANIVCVAGFLFVEVNDNATVTEVILDPAPVVPIEDELGAQLTCTGSPESADLAGYTYNGTTYTSYAALEAAIVATEATVTSASISCNGGFLEVTFNFGATPTEIVLYADKIIPVNSPSGGPQVPCTPGDEAGTLAPYTYNGVTYTTYANLANAIVINEPGISEAVVQCNGVNLEVVVNGDAPETEIVIDLPTPPSASANILDNTLDNFQVDASGSTSDGACLPVISYNHEIYDSGMSLLTEITVAPGDTPTGTYVVGGTDTQPIFDLSTFTGPFFYQVVVTDQCGSDSDITALTDSITCTALQAPTGPRDYTQLTTELADPDTDVYVLGFACGNEESGALATETDLVNYIKGTNTGTAVLQDDGSGNAEVCITNSNEGALDPTTDTKLEKKETFTYTGSDQPATAPLWSNEVIAKVWGAGGGGKALGSNNANGAVGGFSVATLTAADFVVVVGEGGKAGANGGDTAGTYGGGGRGGQTQQGGSTQWDGGSGGGLSGIFTTSFSHANALLIAGGGGGAGLNQGRGGAGGGISGEVGIDITFPATCDAGGGTQSAGGVANGNVSVGNDGAALVGGDGSDSLHGAGGGGGGYYGGAGGGTCGDDSNDMGGGGGSGYDSTGSGNLYQGSANNLPAQTIADPDWDGNASRGTTAIDQDGGDGLVVLTWQECADPVTPVINDNTIDNFEVEVTTDIPAGCLPIVQYQHQILDQFFGLLTSSTVNAGDTPTGPDVIGGTDTNPIFDLSPYQGPFIYRVIVTDSCTTNQADTLPTDAITCTALQVSNDGGATEVPRSYADLVAALADPDTSIYVLDGPCGNEDSGALGTEAALETYIQDTDSSPAVLQDDGSGNAEVCITNPDTGALAPTTSTKLEKKQTFNYTGSDQPATAPSWASEVIAKAWGAGGAQDGGVYGSGGGGGGFVEDVITAQDLVVVVGGGGQVQPASTIGAYGGGGGSGPGARFTHGGGGLSGIFSGTAPMTFDAAGQARSIAIAGGGGGGAYATATQTSSGGAGGGLVGQNGIMVDLVVPDGTGQGGTQIAGGAGGDSGGVVGGSGSELQGGQGTTNTSDAGGGGGGGYWGGGAGNGQVGSGLPSAANNDYGGGGGSGFTLSGGGILLAGSSNVVANSSDPDYQAGVGVGGFDGPGGDGLVVLTWIECPEPVPTAGISLADNQTFDAVSIDLTYTANPECPTPGQTSGQLTVKDAVGGSVIYTESVLATLGHVIDLSPYINGGDIAGAVLADFQDLEFCYTVADLCGGSDPACEVRTVEPYLKAEFNYSPGGDQTATAPAWAVNAEVKAWGAGGGANFGAGGAGAFAGGVLPAANYIVVAGQGGNAAQPHNDTYGFGGSASTIPDQAGDGGGLSGVFTDGAGITASDFARGLIIAGGGGGGQNGTVFGYNADDSNSGGNPDMQGFSAFGTTNDQAGAGGGYRGGSARRFGGTSYIDPSVTSPNLPPQGPSGNFTKNPPNASDPDWNGVAGIGHSSIKGGDGLVVIIWTL